MTSKNLARCTLLAAALLVALPFAAAPASAFALAPGINAPCDDTDLVLACCPPTPINIHFIKEWVLGCTVG